MSKYDPLSHHLRKSGLSHIRMRFEEIEEVLGFHLPASSRRHRAWWSNNPSNNVMTHAWLDAGYRTEDVDIEQRRLAFRRAEKDAGHRGFAEERAGSPSRDAAVGRPDQPAEGDVMEIYGCLRGTVRLIGTVDLTAPADPEWAASDGGVTP